MPGYRKIPQHVHDLIARSSSDTFYIGNARNVAKADIASGPFSHLGLVWDGKAVVNPSASLPAMTNGRWSKYNINGWVKVRRDKEKEDRVVGGWESPNFGDWEKGSHTHWHTVHAYPRETLYGQRIPLLIDVGPSNDDRVCVGFRVDRVFDRTHLDERDLLFACSLLRENSRHHAAVVPTDLSVESWLENQRVTWELLPRGEATFEDVVARLRIRGDTPRVREAQGRYEAMESLNPMATIVGDGEFSRYFGFKFREDLVALECLDYGNALYLMYEDWESLSKRSRIDLLADPNARYDRIIHRAGWEGRLRILLTVKGHDTMG
jgi:hypothetical protein